MAEATPNPRDRRRHVVYITRNTEYHCRDRECVGVRDRHTHRWQRWHPALRTRLVGSLSGKDRVSRNTQQGAKLLFAPDKEESVLLTSTLLASGRPPRESIIHYLYVTWSGEI